MCAAEWRNYSNIKDNLPIEKVFYRTLFTRKENKRIGGKS